MTYYAILHTPTGTLFPTFKGGQRVGSTYIDLPFTGVPRLFATPNAAKNCLRWWLAGKAEPKFDVDEFGVTQSMVGASPGKGDPNRKAEEMAVVEVKLELAQQVLI